MKRFTQILPILLAGALQIMPLLRNIITAPAASSSFAIIMRWTIGSSAALGAYDAFSAASTPYFRPGQTNFVLTQGVFFSNSAPYGIIVTNIGSDPGAYFDLTNSVTKADTGQLGDLNTSALVVPAGMTVKCYDKRANDYLYLAIYGTPTSVTPSTRISIEGGYSGQPSVYTNIFISVVASGSPPVITNQPVSVTTNVGNFVMFSVTHGGTAPFKYQWFFNTNTPLVNYTNFSLTITNVQLTNSGTYSVAITNSSGSTNSTFALLTVWQPPVITNQPASFTNVAGGNATFSVTAGGVPSPAYQWIWNGSTVLLDATNASLSLAHVRAGQAGTYSVTITNAAGATNSVLATLAVTNPPPTAITGLTNGGGVFQFTFIPTVGLTNSVQTNSAPAGGGWAVLTNVPPPATASPITVTDALGTSNRFYRVEVIP